MTQGDAVQLIVWEFRNEKDAVREGSCKRGTLSGVFLHLSEAILKRAPTIVRLSIC